MFAHSNFLAAKFINRVLRDYPQARARLVAYAGRRIDVALTAGALPLPLALPLPFPSARCSLRVTTSGGVDAVGEGDPSADALAERAAVAFTVPLNALPALLRQDEAAYAQIGFTGDSEMAHTLSTIARNVEWDIEEDLSKLFGGGAYADALAHAIASAGRTTVAQVNDAASRVTENIAEYLRYETNAFVSRDQLDALTLENETLRDDVARLEARLRASLQPQQRDRLSTRGDAPKKRDVIAAA